MIDGGAPVVFGINWYSKFTSPVVYNGEKWIGRGSGWGGIQGGHAICCIGASDSRQAVMLLNSWGPGYPPVWMPYKTVELLMKDGGEMAVGLDYIPTPISQSSSPSASTSRSASLSASPSASVSPSVPVETLEVVVNIGNRRYAGEIERTR